MEEKEVEFKQVSEREIYVDKNRFYLGEDNITYITIVGNTDEGIAVKANETILHFSSIVEVKLKSLIDLNKAGKPSFGARKMAKEILVNEKIGKIAMFGIHPVAKVIASFVMGISKKKDMRFFKTKEEALNWLNE